MPHISKISSTMGLGFFNLKPLLPFPSYLTGDVTSCFEHVTTHSRWVNKISESGVLPWCERMQWEKPRPNITTTTTTHSPRHAPTHAPTHARPGLPVDQIPNPVANKTQYYMILLLAIKLFLHTFLNKILALLHN